MLHRREFLYGLAAAGAFRYANAAGIPKVGYLSLGPVPEVLQAFEDGLRALGWIEGQNVIIERRFARNSAELFPRARELVEAGVGLIVAVSSNAAVQAAREASAAIPIVMVSALDPVAQGFIASLRNPGGNITGLAWDQNPQIAEKYFEFLKEIVPRLSRVGVLFDPSVPGLALYRDASNASARRLGLTLLYVEIRSPADFEGGFKAIVEQGAQAVDVFGSSIATVNASIIVGLAARHRLPDIYIFKGAVSAGGLMSYGVSLVDLNRRAAGYVDKILRGTNPAVLPVELPTRYEMAINLKTAQRLGLEIPQALLLRADEIIR